MKTLNPVEVEAVGGGQATLSNCVAAVGLGIAIATAPAWGAAAALIALTALAVKTLE